MRSGELLQIQEGAERGLRPNREPGERVLSVLRVSLCPQRNEPQKASGETETRSIVDVVSGAVITLKIGCQNVAQGHVTTKVVSGENHDKQRVFLCSQRCTKYCDNQSCEVRR